MEDCGQEQWDKALHTLLSAEYNQDTTPPKLTMYDVQLTHEQLMDAEKYPKRELLDPSVSNIALAEALEESECYKKKKVYTTASSSGDFRPYPCKFIFRFEIVIPSQKYSRFLEIWIRTKK